MPRLRAVPSMVRTAASRSFTFKSGSLRVAISFTCARVKEPTVFFAGSLDPFSTPADFLIKMEAGGVLVTKEKERSAYTVTMTGIKRPCWACVRALKALQNSIMLTPRCPSAGPTGGLGVACPAGIWSFTAATTFRAILRQSLSGLFDLHQVEFDWRCPTKDADQHPQISSFWFDLSHHTREIVHRPVDDLNPLSRLR